MTTYTPDTPRPGAPRPLWVQCLSFADEVGYTLDETSDYHNPDFGSLAQAEVIERIYSTDSLTGRYLYPTTCQSEARQNGKGEIYEVVEFFDAFILKGKVLRNAQVMPTASEAQTRLWARIQSAELQTRVSEYKIGSNEKCIIFKSGGGIWYSARTGKAGRGITKVSRITYDEAQDLRDIHVQASSSTTLVAAHSQIGFLGSAGMAHSLYWYDLRLKALSGKFPNLLWNEFTAEIVERDKDGDPEFLAPDPEDRANWLKANAGLVHGRIKHESMEDEYTRLTPEAFATEHLNVWVPPPNRLMRGAKKLRPELWAGMVDSDSKFYGQYVISIAADGEGSASSIATAGWRNDDRAHAELVKYSPGTSWVSTIITKMIKVSRPKVVALDVAGASGVLVEELTRVCKENGDVPLVKYGKAAQSTAAQNIVRLSKDDLIRHGGDMDVSYAIETSKAIAYGDSWRWHEESEGKSSPLVAITNALFAVERVSKRRSAYEDDDEETTTTTEEEE